MRASGLDSQEAEPGDRFGRYEILACLASGGMGRVYLARTRGAAGFEKTVALKTIHPDLASRPDFVQMFLDEAHIAAQLDHPNVCRVSDFGQAEGTYYIAMEHLVGEPLSGVLAALDRAGAPPSAQTDAKLVRIVADAAEGLHAAHELTGDDGELIGLVHRDVSPHNVFVCYDGGVRIVDFGVASAAGRGQRSTGAELKGKLAYMAPEQVNRGPLDRRVDVWGLGVVLWEALAGAGLWSGPSEVALLMSIVQDPVTPLRRVRPDVPVELDAIVMRALEKDPERRWATARELGQALQRWLVMRGEVVGLAEIAGLMAATFPGGRTQKLAVLDRMKVASGDATERARSGPRGRMVAANAERASHAPPVGDGARSGGGSATLAETFVGGRPSTPVAAAGAGTFVGSIDPRLSGPVGRPMLGAAPVEAPRTSRAPSLPPLDPNPTPIVDRSSLDVPFAPPPIAVVPDDEIVRHDRRAVWRARAPWLGGAAALALAVAGLAWLGGGVSSNGDRGMVATPLASARVVLPTVLPTVVPAAPLAPSVAPTLTPVAPVPVDPPAPVVLPTAPAEVAPVWRSAPGTPPVEATSPAPEAARPGGVGSRSTPAPTAEPRSAPAHAEPGVVVVSTEGGWADVWVGGESVGDTRGGPLRVELPAGRHTIELRPFGLRAPGAGLSRAVTIEAGGTRRVSVGLEE